jgi:hypothetical protein
MKNQLSLAPGSDIYWPEAIRPVVKSQTEIYFVFITWIIWLISCFISMIYYWKIVESGVKHNNPNPNPYHFGQ